MVAGGWCGDDGLAAYASDVKEGPMMALVG